MDWQKQCAVVIPCRNEAGAIEPLVRAVRPLLPAVYAVDDGSSDQTAALAAQAGAQVLHPVASTGKGAALRTGWRHARENGFHWALAMDGDGQHSPQDIPELLRCAERTSATLVVGNRMAEAAQMPWLRRHVNRWMSATLSNLAGQYLPDSQCGFRLMKLDAWSALPITATHFEIESEVLLAFVAAGHRVEFVPVSVIYKGEHSKIHPVRDSVRWLRWYRRMSDLQRSPQPTAPSVTTTRSASLAR